MPNFSFKLYVCTSFPPRSLLLLLPFPSQTPTFKWRWTWPFSTEIHFNLGPSRPDNLITCIISFSRTTVHWIHTPISIAYLPTVRNCRTAYKSLIFPHQQADLLEINNISKISIIYQLEEVIKIFIQKCKENVSKSPQ